jgi:hypothetical protein
MTFLYGDAPRRTAKGSGLPGLRPQPIKKRPLLLISNQNIPGLARAWPIAVLIGNYDADKTKR